MTSPSSSRPASVVSPVRIRVSQLVPAVADGIKGHAELSDAARAWYLYLAVRPGASHTFTRTLLSLSLRLNATAHLHISDSIVRSIDAAVERELRHGDVMTRSVPGGSPGLGKRR